ncbi:hypothetical protein DPMN_086895 [Dreissena polymorpha]|uniref:Uncharacterized protein n=1 Tax=Dreissena polymorpha TaxID=45954 RepID=A0A9D4QUZ7_DREPO|nr:hypothetical protein DPMN_086895 [Dreissena polymorpha]
MGAGIGLIDIPHTTCADDLVLLSNSDWEMNLMLKLKCSVEDTGMTSTHQKAAASGLTQKAPTQVLTLYLKALASH